MKIKSLMMPIMSFVTTVYTLWYMHYGTCYRNSGALSKIGLTHHTEFVIWGVLTMLTLSYGIIISYRKYTTTRVYIPMLIVSCVGMALTLAFRFDYDIMPDYYFHCVGSLAFSVLTGVNIFVLYLLNFKDKLFRIFTFITGAVLLIDFVLLLIFKETGLIEVVPIFVGYILLTITCTRRSRVEAIR